MPGWIKHLMGWGALIAILVAIVAAQLVDGTSSMLRKALWGVAAFFAVVAAINEWSYGGGR